MSGIRLWVGSVSFALGVAGLIWWIRNLFRDRLRQAMGFSKHPFLFLALPIILTCGGLWVYSDFRLIPLVGLLAGILVGWWISR